MSIIDHFSQVTDVSYQTIESNLKWEIRNPAELKSLVKSDKMRIPLINGKWCITVESGWIYFKMDIIKENEVELVKDRNSKDDEYCFEVTFNGVQCETNGFKTISAKISEKVAVNVVVNSYNIFNIEAKVTIKTSRKLNGKFMNLESKLNNFIALMSDKTHSDFTIIVKSKEFKVHKAVLSVRSPVFKMMFLSNMKEAADNKAEITDIEPCTFEKLLYFIYCGKIPEDLDNYVMDLFVAADKYGIQDLKDACETYISMNVTKENAMAVLNMANLYECHHDLKKLSLQVIKEQLKDNLLNLDGATMEKLLKNKISIKKLLN